MHKRYRSQKLINPREKDRRVPRRRNDKALCLPRLHGSSLPFSSADLPSYHPLGARDSGSQLLHLQRTARRPGTAASIASWLYVVSALNVVALGTYPQSLWKWDYVLHDIYLYETVWCWLNLFSLWRCRYLSLSAFCLITRIRTGKARRATNKQSAWTEWKLVNMWKYYLQVSQKQIKINIKQKHVSHSDLSCQRMWAR